MDKSAIQEIIRLITANFDGAAPLNDGSAIIIPDGYKIQNLEQFDPYPKAFKALFSTTVLAEYIDYVNKHGDETTGIFIDPINMTSNAIIDLGEKLNPLWGKHQAKIKLLKTPAYKALLHDQNGLLTQQELIDFAEDWQDSVHFYSGDANNVDKVPFTDIIKILRRLKINANSASEQNVTNFSASKSALEAIEITAGQDPLPTGFIFETVPYEGFEPVRFNCQLRAINEEKAVKLKYRIGQLDLINEIIADKFREFLKTGLKAELTYAIFIGTMDYQ